MVKPLAKDGAPLWEVLIVDRAYPLWRRLMARALDFSPELIAKAPEDINEAFELVAARLGSAPYLGGETPSNIDIVFSALAAPVIFPPQYGARLPKLDELPQIQALHERTALIELGSWCCEPMPTHAANRRFD